VFETTLEDGTVLQWNIGERCLSNDQIVTIMAAPDSNGLVEVYWEGGWNHSGGRLRVHLSLLRKLPSAATYVLAESKNASGLSGISVTNGDSAISFFARDGGSTHVFGERFPTVRLTNETETLLAALLRPRNVLESLARAAIEGDRAAAAALVDAVQDWLNQ
jgi:hypothetical protein